MKRIYFDNGSTSFPKAPGVSDAVKGLLDNGAFNINRGGYDEAYQISEQVLETRELLCRMFNFDKPKNAVFTPSITYSLNYLIKGYLKPGDHVITSSMEHNAVMRPLVQMEKQGVTFDCAQCEPTGALDPERVEALIRPNTRAVVMMAASNVCGTFLPIKEVGEICRRRGIKFFVDSAQTAGTFHIDMKEMNIDALTFTGHKGLLGPQGVGGFLLQPDMVPLVTPLIAGGTGSVSHEEQMPSFLPDKFEAGTLNLPGIMGLHAALCWLERETIDKVRSHELALTERFLIGAEEIPNLRVIGRKGTEGRVGVVSVLPENVDPALMADALGQEYGIMVRVGLHCAPNAHKTLGTFPTGTIRFSFGHQNTTRQVDAALLALRKLCGRTTWN